MRSKLATTLLSAVLMLCALPAASATPNPTRTASTLARGQRGEQRTRLLRRRANSNTRRLGDRTTTAHRARLATTTELAESNTFEQLGHRIANNDFKVCRNLASYRNTFGVSFSRRLNALGPDEHWIDMGAGEANAIVNFIQSRTPESLPRITAVAVTRPPTAAVSDHFRYLEGRVLADHTAENLGQADLITDLFGPGVYGGELDQTVEQYGLLLREGGDVFIHMGKHVTLNGSSFSPNSSAEQIRLTSIVQRWVNASQGFSLMDVSDQGVVHLRRTSGPVRMSSLRLRRVQANDEGGAGWRYDYRFTPDHVRPEAQLHGNE